VTVTAGGVVAGAQSDAKGRRRPVGRLARADRRRAQGRRASDSEESSGSRTDGETDSDAEAEEGGLTPCRICAGTGLSTICTGTRLTAATYVSRFGCAGVDEGETLEDGAEPACWCAHDTAYNTARSHLFAAAKPAPT
jgi:hypothetical protein